MRDSFFQVYTWHLDLKIKYNISTSQNLNYIGTDVDADVVNRPPRLRIKLEFYLPGVNPSLPLVFKRWKQNIRFVFYAMRSLDSDGLWPWQDII